MSTEDAYANIFDKVAADKKRAEHESSARAVEAKNAAFDDFNIKAKCLREVVLPALQSVSASWDSKGYAVLIDEHTTPKEGPSFAPNPTVGFMVYPTSLSEDVAAMQLPRYFFEVTHTQGGVKLGRLAPSRPGMEWIGAGLGIGKADELSEQTMAKVLELALSRAMS